MNLLACDTFSTNAHTPTAVHTYRRDGIFWLPAGKDATERLPWLLEYLAVQLSLVLSSGQAGESKANRMGALAGRGAKQVPYRV